MPRFDVDEDLALLIERLAQSKPFEHLSFSDALRRVLIKSGYKGLAKPDAELNELLSESLSLAESKKALSPSAEEWAASISELTGNPGLRNWKAICDALGIETGGDSARRKLRNWVKSNRPNWTPVPDVA